MKEGTDLDRLLQVRPTLASYRSTHAFTPTISFPPTPQNKRRDGLVAAQEALLGHDPFGTARRRASRYQGSVNDDDDDPTSASNHSSVVFLHRPAHPPTPPLLSSQLRALVRRELGPAAIVRTVGEADPLLAWGVAAPGSPYLAVLSRDSDFLVYAGGRLLAFDLLNTDAMTVRR